MVIFHVKKINNKKITSFQLVVKKSEPDLILNGRAALCAGRDDMSDEEADDDDLNHRFSKPENLRKFLESGSIPDAAMINAARLARNKKRIQGKLGMFVL